MVAIKHELDTVQQVKEEIEELREYVDRLEEHTHRRKLRLLEQVGSTMLCFFLQRIYIVFFCFFFGSNKFNFLFVWVIFYFLILAFFLRSSIS
jgi:hypothetical protein